MEDGIGDTVGWAGTQNYYAFLRVWSMQRALCCDARFLIAGCMLFDDRLVFLIGLTRRFASASRMPHYLKSIAWLKRSTLGQT